MCEKSVIDAAPTQSWEAGHSEKAEHSGKALPTDKATRASKPAVDLKLFRGETSDMAVQEGKHGSVSVDDLPWTHVEPESISASYVTDSDSFIVNCPAYSGHKDWQCSNSELGAWAP